MIEIRPCTDDADDEESLAIYNAVWPWDAVSMHEVRSWRTQVTEWADFLAPGAGSADVALTPWHPGIGQAHVCVLPGQRRKGVGTALYHAVSGWLSARGIDVLDVTVPEDDPASVEFAAKRGFHEERRSERLVLDLTGLEPPPIAPPKGIEIVTWAERPDLIQGIYEVAAESAPDIPGEEDAVVEPFEDWLAHDMHGSGDRPEATFVALAGDEVVGYAKFSLTVAQPTTAHHDLTAVRRAWRGKGIAGALKRTQVAWAKEHGYERLVTVPDLRNEPSRRMNQRLGYQPAPGKIFMRGPLAER